MAKKPAPRRANIAVGQTAANLPKRRKAAKRKPAIKATAPDPAHDAAGCESGTCGCRRSYLRSS